MCVVAFVPEVTQVWRHLVTQIDGTFSQPLRAIFSHFPQGTQVEPLGSPAKAHFPTARPARTTQIEMKQDLKKATRFLMVLLLLGK